MSERRQLRATFEEVPELYDRARPTYPPALFDDLVALTALPSGALIVEIGPGTGQATLPLAERGFEVIGVELSEGLAVLARRKLAGFPNVRIAAAPLGGDLHGDEYIAVLDTYSGHRSYDEVTRHRLYDRIHRRIRLRPGERVTKAHLATLNVARRLG